MGIRILILASLIFAGCLGYEQEIELNPGGSLDQKSAPDSKEDSKAGTSDSANKGKPGQDSTDQTATARAVLDDALAQAKSADKALFVHFTADW